MANDDLDALRHDPGFMMALGKAPGEAVGVASQPTMSRWENAPDLRTLIRIGREMADIYCASHDVPPEAVILDIDDTVDAAHGQQQLTFWNGFHGERGYAPIHVYETGSGRPVGFVLRPARTPSGKEIRGHVRRLVRRIRSHWPDTGITLRGDGHYARPEVMAWCEAQGIDYLFGLPGNAVLRKDTVIARIEASIQGMDIRTIVTSIRGVTAERLYEFDYCDRGQAENLIKLHKTQIKSDRTSCMSAAANQMRVRRAFAAPLGPRSRLTPAHRRLLAALDTPPGDPRNGAAETGGVHHPADPPGQDRRPHHRDRNPDPHRLRLCLPGQGPDRPARPGPRGTGEPKTAGPLTAPPRNAPQALKPQHPRPDQSARCRERPAIA